MNHLEIIKEAYDRCGIKYIIKEQKGNEEYEPDTINSYLFLTGDNEDTIKDFENKDLQLLLMQESFIEFCNGKIASY